MLNRSEDNIVYEEIDKLIAKYKKENLDELNNDIEIIEN